MAHHATTTTTRTAWRTRDTLSIPGPVRSAHQCARCCVPDARGPGKVNGSRTTTAPIAPSEYGPAALAAVTSAGDGSGIGSTDEAGERPASSTLTNSTPPRTTRSKARHGRAQPITDQPATLPTFRGERSGAVMLPTGEQQVRSEAHRNYGDLASAAPLTAHGATDRGGTPARNGAAESTEPTAPASMVLPRVSL